MFGDIRTMTNKSGETFFVGKDVAKALGYKNPQKALRDHVDEEDKTLNVSFTVNGTTPVIINESGLYSLVLSSKLPQAKVFKHWVTSEVLPQIRKTGRYELRYTLWLEGISPSELRSMPLVMERVTACKQARENSPAAAIRKFAEIPHLYAQRIQPNIPKLDDNGNPLFPDGQRHYNLLVPEVSSERRKYVPTGSLNKIRKKLKFRILRIFHFHKCTTFAPLIVRTTYTTLYQPLYFPC